MSFIFKWNRPRRNRSIIRLFFFYAICFAVTALIARIFSTYTCVTLASAFPVILSIGMIGLANETAFGHRNGAIAPTLSEVDKEFSKAHLAPGLIGEYICLLIVPAFYPFIFFCSSMAKIIISMVIFATPFILMFVLAMIYNLLWMKSVKKQNQGAKNELEEQKKREELGKWK